MVGSCVKGFHTLNGLWDLVKVKEMKEALIRFQPERVAWRDTMV